MAEHVYLASKSPRRLELLTSLGLKVTVAAGNAHTRGYFEGDEEVRPGEHRGLRPPHGRNEVARGLDARDGDAGV